jgi:hypothetical protein
MNTIILPGVAHSGTLLAALVFTAGRVEANAPPGVDAMSVAAKAAATGIVFM